MQILWRRVKHLELPGGVVSVGNDRSNRAVPAAGAYGDSFEDLYRSQFPALMRVAYLMSHSTEAAEDAVHDVFMRCAPRFETIEHLPSYLRSAVVNECRTQHRRWDRDHHRPGFPTSCSRRGPRLAASPRESAEPSYCGTSWTFPMRRSLKCWAVARQLFARCCVERSTN